MRKQIAKMIHRIGSYWAWTPRYNPFGRILTEDEKRRRIDWFEEAKIMVRTLGLETVKAIWRGDMPFVATAHEFRECGADRGCIGSCSGRENFEEIVMDTEEQRARVRASLHRLLEAEKVQGRQIAKVQWADVHEDE